MNYTLSEKAIAAGLKVLNKDLNMNAATRFNQAFAAAAGVQASLDKADSIIAAMRQGAVATVAKLSSAGNPQKSAKVIIGPAAVTDWEFNHYGAESYAKGFNYGIELAKAATQYRTVSQATHAEAANYRLLRAGLVIDGLEVQVCRQSSHHDYARFNSPEDLDEFLAKVRKDLNEELIIG